MLTRVVAQLREVCRIPRREDEARSSLDFLAPRRGRRHHPPALTHHAFALTHLTLVSITTHPRAMAFAVMFLVHLDHVGHAPAQLGHIARRGER